MCARGQFLSAFFVWIIAIVCCGCAGSGISSGECEYSTDCPDNFVCRNYACVQRTGSDGGTCAPNERLVDGRCQILECACRSDDDCPGQRCVDCACYDRLCEDGQTRDCNTTCGGKQQCRSGVWQPCRQPETERCGDNIDNDCNGEADEGCSCTEGMERECSNRCGRGVEICANGAFGGCTAPVPQEQDVCGNDIDEDCDGQLDNGCACTQEGATRACMTACGSGVETCTNGVYAGCTAQTTQSEFCDNLDNDCNGDIDDNLVRNCSNSCGAGTETCVGGQWLACDAPESCPCNDGEVDEQVCSVLGGTPCGSRKRTCVGEQWGPWSECEEKEDACVPGTVTTEPCASACGTERRTCNDVCEWQISPCTGTGECTVNDRRDSQSTDACQGTPEICNDMCQWVSDAAPSGAEGSCTSPGEVEEGTCGNCGRRTRTCLPCYRWSDWSQCSQLADACTPGEEELESCGASCETRTRTCQNDCTWSGFSECSSGGECSPTENRTTACGLCGSKTQTCDSNCIWQDSTACENEGECDPAIDDDAESRTSCAAALGAQGLCAGGEARRSCDPTTCTWSSWGECSVQPTSEICGDGDDQDCNGEDERQRDSYESHSSFGRQQADNDSCETCFLLSEDDDVEGDLAAKLDSRNDDDYYCFWGKDAGALSLSVFPEYVTVELKDIPQGSDYDIFVYQGLGGDRNERREAATINCNIGSSASINKRDRNGVIIQGTEGGNADEKVSWKERFYADDSGFYIIHVNNFTRTPACFDNYDLTYKGLK